MTKRMIAALLSLTGIFVALYLLLYKLGYIGTLVCAVGSCEVVQTSKWATFLGMPVAGWGVGYYILMLLLAVVGLDARLADDRRYSQLLMRVTAVGTLFSLWLTYLELYVIHAICQWCVVSAIIATLLFVTWWLDLRDLTVLEEADEIAGRLRREQWGGALRDTQEVVIRATQDE